MREAEEELHREVAAKKQKEAEEQVCVLCGCSSLSSYLLTVSFLLRHKVILQVYRCS